jgi:hypothetical protein
MAGNRAHTGQERREVKAARIFLEHGTPQIRAHGCEREVAEAVMFMPLCRWLFHQSRSG